MRSPLKLTLLAMGILLAAQVQATPVVNYTPSVASFGSGDTVTVDVSITGLGSDIVSAYDLAFLFNPSVLNVTGVTFTNNLGDPLNFEAITDDTHLTDLTGLADFLEVSLLSDAELATLQAPLGGTVGLATLSFLATAAGDSSAFQGFRFDAPLHDVKCSLGAQCVPETSVPEPATLALLGLGLAGLGFARVRRS